jgi:hypothetical protein
MEAGEYESAAEIYERLAGGAEQRGMVRRAPHLYIQAARARLRSGRVDRAEGLLYYGLKLLLESEQWGALHRVGHAAIEEYIHLEDQVSADKLHSWLDEVLVDIPDSAYHSGALEERRPTLPEKCPFCGASIRPNEIEWLDKITAECLYCGSSVQAED